MRHASLPVIFFPAIIGSVLGGGYWPVVYAIVSISIYLVFDAYSLRPAPATRHSTAFSWISDLCLFLQIPLSIILLLSLIVSIDQSLIGESYLNNFGIKLHGFHGWNEIIIAAIVVGFHLSTSFIVAHEMMHRKGKFWKSCSRLLLMMLGDAHFQEAHLYGHHANVGTLQDPATAKRGEPLYHFVIRSAVGQWKEAYSFECNRLRNKTYKLINNRVIRYNIGSLFIFSGIGFLFDFVVMFSYILVALVAKFLLESINYIQHYGLKRQEGERISLSHSWESNALASSLILFKLTHHAQHHIKPNITHDKLEFSIHSPSLPRGYMAALLTCFIPSRWFKSMHPILDHYNKNGK